MERKFKFHGKNQKFNLYRFARTILNYTKLQEDPHQSWCRELERHHRRSLWLEPRGTFKSTIFTKAYPIWRLVNDPELRILIVNATAENAQAFLREIVGHYLRNPSLLEFYEENFGIRPLDPNAAKKEYIMLNTRTKNFSEPSIGTAGALDNLVSVHYDIIIVDDLCNIDDRESAAIREKKKRWYQDLVSVLEPRGELVVVGTHWHFDDLYSFIINELNPQFPRGHKYSIHRESCYTHSGKPRFPTILSKARLEALRIEKGQLLFACQYLNQPIPAEHQIFRLEAMHTIPRSIIDLEGAEAFAFCDPSLGVRDLSAIVTVLKHHLGWIVYHCEMARLAQSKLIAQLIELHSRFNYKVVGIEANSLGKAKSDTEPCSFELVLRELQREAGVTVPYKLVWHTVPKAARIEGLEPYYTNGQLQFLESWNQEYPELIDQLIQFPLAAHDDGPDALAGAITLIQEHAKPRPQVLYPRAR